MSSTDDQLTEDINAAKVCDGGNLDCGSGLLLIIRKAMDEVPAGDVLEIRSTEVSVCEDLPAWCRLTNNPYLGWKQSGGFSKFWVRRGDALSDTNENEKARNFKWQCRARWNGGPTAKVYARNHAWEVGQPASFDVKDVAPSAVEYLLGALAGALAMGFQIQASRQGIELDELEISLSGRIDNIMVFLGLEREGHSGFKDVSGTVYVRSNADEQRLAELWQETVKASPLVNSLAHSPRLDLTLKVIP
jgi:TusA-related sulfurtransferase/uncharacterized OsmC-like protein